MTDIDKKITDIVEGKNLSQSQLDRLAGPKALLFDYLSTHLKKVQERNPLLEKMFQDFEANYDSYSDGMKVRIFELLLKKESEDNTPLVNMFAKALEVKAEKGKESKDEQSSEQKHNDSFSQNDMQAAKQIVNAINKLQSGELSDEEFLRTFKKTN